MSFREKAVISVKQSLLLHMRYLQLAEEQVAQWGADVPVKLLLEIESRKDKVEELRREFEELQNMSDEEYELFVITGSNKEKTVDKKTSVELTEGEKITLRKMLADLISEYLTETEDIEVSFNSTEHSYKVILRSLSNQSDETE